MSLNSDGSTQPGAIILRRITTQELNLTVSPDLRNAITAAATEFIQKSMAVATNCAFHLIYAIPEPDDHSALEKELNKIHLTLVSQKSFNPNAKLNFVPSETLRVIGAELVHQYQIRNPRFLTISPLDGCQNEFSVLESEVKYEPVLMYCIYRMLSGCYKTGSVSNLIAMLKSDSVDVQKKAFEELKQNPVYLSAMLPFANSIATLLEAMQKQHEAQKHLVKKSGDPTVFKKACTPVTVSVPEKLIAAIPELAPFVPYIIHHEKLETFREKHQQILATFGAMAKYGFSIDAYLNDPRPATQLFDSTIPENFKNRIFDLAKEVQGDNTQINQLVSICRVLPILLPPYNAVKNAFDENEKAEKALSEAHNAVSNMSPIANDEYIAAVTTLEHSAKNAQATSQKYNTAAETFKKVLSNHQQM